MANEGGDEQAIKWVTMDSVARVYHGQSGSERTTTECDQGSRVIESVQRV